MGWANLVIHDNLTVSSPYNNCHNPMNALYCVFLLYVLKNLATLTASTTSLNPLTNFAPPYICAIQISFSIIGLHNC